MAKQKKPKLPAIRQLPSGAYRTQIYTGKNPVTGKREYDSFTDRDYSAVVLWATDRLRDRELGIDRTSPANMTFGQAMEEYIDSKSAILSPSTIREYRRIRRRRLASLMPVPLARITQTDIQRAINIEATNLSPKSVRNIHGLLSATLTVYRPDMRLVTTLPQRQKNEIEIPTDEEIKTLLAASAGTPLEVPLYLAACCGLRRSEICALHWSDINFDKNTLTVKGALVLNDEGDFVLKGTKTTAGTRTIYLLPIVADVLRKAYDGRLAESKMVTSLTPTGFYHRYDRMLTACGIRHYSLHSLRHYTVSVLLLLNVPKKYIADYVGHGSEKMIDQVYGHVMRDKKATFTDQLNEYFARLI